MSRHCHCGNQKSADKIECARCAALTVQRDALQDVSHGLRELELFVHEVNSEHQMGGPTKFTPERLRNILADVATIICNQQRIREGRPTLYR